MENKEEAKKELNAHILDKEIIKKAAELSCEDMEDQKGWEERFLKQFTALRFGDGSPAGGGKGVYTIIKENFNLGEVIEFIHQVEQDAYERGYKICLADGIE